MSDWHPEIARIHSVEPHPNADRLEVAMVYGTTPCVVRRGEYQAGDLIAYIPVDSQLPAREEFSFLEVRDRQRLRAKRLRGVFSMGLVVKAPEGFNEGDSVTEHFGLTKYEPPQPGEPGEPGRVRPKQDDADGVHFPLFTDIDGWRRHKGLFADGELVALTEKIHGMNARYLVANDRLYLGSHHRIWTELDSSAWAEVARRYELEQALRSRPGLAIYGEVYGRTPTGSRVQDLDYGAKATEFVLFDAFDTNVMRWLSYGELRQVAQCLGLPRPPVLYEGPWSESLLAHAEGPTVLGGGCHVREGFVVRPLDGERFELRMPGCRAIAKHVGQGYLLRKEAA